MNFKEEHTTLFDDYLTGSMTDKDKSLFEERISGNHEFKTEFMAYKTFISAVEEALNYEVTRNIKLGEIKYQKNRLIKGLMVFVTLLILAILGIKLFLPTKKKRFQKPILKVENLEKTSSKEIETIDSLKKEDKELVKVQGEVKTTRTLPSVNKEKKARIVVNMDFVKVKGILF